MITQFLPAVWAVDLVLTGAAAVELVVLLVARRQARVRLGLV